MATGKLMDCPDCGYALSSFDKECPRCKNYKAKGIPASLPIVTKPAPAPEPVVYQEPAPRPMRNITPQASASQPVVQEPAPLIIYTNKVVRWQPWAVLAAVLLVVIGVVWYYQAQQAAITKAIVLAARQGACDRIPENNDDRERAACTQLTGALDYHIVRDSPENATVTFFLSGFTSSLQVVLNQDEQGGWHAVSANTGDEGSRTSWSDRRFGSPAPSSDSTSSSQADQPVAAPTPPDPATTSNPPPVVLPPAPAANTDTPSPSQEGSSSGEPAYTMRTKSGGGQDPKFN